MGDFFDDEDGFLDTGGEERAENVMPSFYDDPLAPLEDEGFEDDAGLGHEPEPVQQQTAPQDDVQSRKERMQALANLAKRSKAAEEGPKKSKKQKRDKQQQDGEAGTTSRQQRLRQKAASAEADRQQRQFEPELGEDEYVETAADKDFIDDDGVPEDERYEGDDLEVLARAEEAEEAAPGDEDEAEPTNLVDEVLKRRKRRRREDDHEVDNEVLMLVSQMTACADKDSSTMESGTKQPAMEKFKALPEVERVLRQRKYHETFLANRGLYALASWLRPYPNGELPNAKIRNSLVDLLALMQLDTSNDYTRERLEESELGKIIMFYWKNPNEKNMMLKTKCRDLVQAWSAPIFADADEEYRKRRLREREHRIRMAHEKNERAEREKREQDEAEKRRRANQGEEGFRARAAVPQPGRLDFVINPGSRVDPLDAAMKGRPALGSNTGGPKTKSPIGGALGKALQQRKRGAKNRFGGVSVEGRGIQL